MKTLITGSKGQLGQELLTMAPEGSEIIAYDVDELDITRGDAVRDCLLSRRPDLVINAAAYTAVDKAESDKDNAFAVNADGPKNIAAACKLAGARMIHISTDFVFDGKSSRPYLPGDPAAPISVYGASKLEGERQALGHNEGRTAVVRTSWLYSRHGGNFVKTMLRLMKDKPQVGVVSDQIGTPTWARTLAEAVWRFAKKPELFGIYHLSDAGVASWYDFAVAIQEEALSAGLLGKKIPVLPIMSEDYRTAARRPAYSVLDKSVTWQATGMTPLHWRTALKEMLKDMAEFNEGDAR